MDRAARLMLWRLRSALLLAGLPWATVKVFSLHEATAMARDVALTHRQRQA